MLTIEQIQREAFATATEKGWHERSLCKIINGDAVFDRIVDHDRVLAKHALMHTEFAEMHDCLIDNDLVLRIDPKTSKPEGLIVEAADALIRIADTTAALGITLNLRDGWTAYAPYRADTAHSDALEHIALARLAIDRATEAARVDNWLLYADHLTIALTYLAIICAGLSLDLGAAIETKMAYNKTRPHRHGGKQA
jgi:hypothetical protein